MNRHQWGEFCNIVKIIYQQFLTCQVILEKLILFPEPQTYPSGPFEHLQLDFISAATYYGLPMCPCYSLYVLWMS